MKRHGFPRMQPCRKWPNSGGGWDCAPSRVHGNSCSPQCENFFLESRLYSYKVDDKTGEVKSAIVDKHNHLIDALRYALQPLIYGEKRRRSRKSRLQSARNGRNTPFLVQDGAKSGIDIIACHYSGSGFRAFA